MLNRDTMFSLQNPHVSTVVRMRRHWKHLSILPSTTVAASNAQQVCDNVERIVGTFPRNILQKADEIVEHLEAKHLAAMYLTTSKYEHPSK